jgi:RNA-directed DNA polymerase
VGSLKIYEKPSICRKKLHAFRSLLHQIDKSGPDGKKWGSPGLSREVCGQAIIQ